VAFSDVAVTLFLIPDNQRKDENKVKGSADETTSLKAAEKEEVC